MNQLTLTFWAQAFGFLAAQAAIIVAVTAALQRSARGPRWQRASWLAGFLALAAVLAAWACGLDLWAANPLESRTALERTVRVRANLLPDRSGAVRAQEADNLRRNWGDEGAAKSPFTSPAGTVWWPAWLWLGGIVAFAGRSLLARWLLARIKWRGRARPAPAEVSSRVEELARRMAFRRSVRVVESAVLTGPIGPGCCWFAPPRLTSR